MLIPSFLSVCFSPVFDGPEPKSSPPGMPGFDPSFHNSKPSEGFQRVLWWCFDGSLMVHFRIVFMLLWRCHYCFRVFGGNFIGG